MHWLHFSENGVILASAVLSQYTHVTDRRQTTGDDRRHTMTITERCIATVGKKLHQLKGYNVRQLRTEFSDKGWTTSNINRLLKNFKDTGTVDWATNSVTEPAFFQSHSHFPEVNKYAFKKLVISFVIPSFFFQHWKNCENRLSFQQVKGNKIKRVSRAQCM